MTLAGMINLDESALICDLAETYGVYDYRQLPLHTAAVLAAGLRENARIIRKKEQVEGQPDLNTQLLAIIADRLVGAKPKDSLYYAIMGKAVQDEEADTKRIVGKVYDSPEAFMKERYKTGGE